MSLDVELSSYPVVDGIEWVGVDRPTVFQVPSELLNQTLETILDGKRCGGQHGYVVEYFVCKDTVILIFDRLPTQYDIETIQTIRKVESWIVSGDECQMIKCDTCGNKVHWTSMDTCAGISDRSISLMERALMLRYGVCCCREHHPDATPRMNKTGAQAKRNPSV